jgi:hypothetical protein
VAVATSARRRRESQADEAMRRIGPKTLRRAARLLRGVRSR